MSHRHDRPLTGCALAYSGQPPTLSPTRTPGRWLRCALHADAVPAPAIHRCGRRDQESSLKCSPQAPNRPSKRTTAKLGNGGRTIIDVLRHAVTRRTSRPSADDAAPSASHARRSRTAPLSSQRQVAVRTRDAAPSPPTTLRTRTCRQSGRAERAFEPSSERASQQGRCSGLSSFSHVGEDLQLFQRGHASFTSSGTFGPTEQGATFCGPSSRQNAPMVISSTGVCASRPRSRPGSTGRS